MYLKWTENLFLQLFQKVCGAAVAISGYKYDRLIVDVGKLIYILESVLLMHPSMPRLMSGNPSK